MGGRPAALLTILSFLASLVWSNAAWVRGEKHIPANGAVFIAKYCFDFDPTGNSTGEVNFRMRSVTPAKGQMKIILLNDQSDSYPDSNSRWPGFDCHDERLNAVAKMQVLVHADGEAENQFLHTYIAEKLRPRFWFVAALDCSGVARSIEYDLHMLNLEQGWMKEISMDHCGVVALSFFLAVYLATALLQVWALFMQSAARTKHPLRLLLTSGICQALWGMSFYTIDTVWFAARGEDAVFMYIGAKLFKVWSKFTLLLICNLVSKGRGVSHDLKFGDIIKGAILIVPFLVFCLGLEIWGEYDQSRKYTTNFVYCTWVGGVLVFADLLLLGMYLSNLLQTYRAESAEEKKVFYRTWGAVYSSAFLSLPVAIIVASLVAPHVRVAVMFILSNSIHSVLLALLVLGLWPERPNQVFCIDKPDLACTFGNQAGSLLDCELKLKGGDYREFDMEDSILINGNG